MIFISMPRAARPVLDLLSSSGSRFCPLGLRLLCVDLHDSVWRMLTVRFEGVYVRVSEPGGGLCVCRHACVGERGVLACVCPSTYHLFISSR